MKRSLLALPLLAALSFGATAAEGVSWNYVEGGYAATDTDAPGATDAAAAPGGESEDAEDTGDGAATRQPAQG